MLKSYKYYLENLDCANCAKQVEEAVAKLDNFKDVVVNFNTLTISFKTNIDEPFNEVANTIKRIEPDTIVYKEKNNYEKKDYEIVRLVFAGMALVLAIIIKEDLLSNILLIVSYILVLYKIVIKAFKKIIKIHRIDENLLVSISGVGAYILGEHMEGLMVIFFYAIGKILEEKAVNKSRSSIKELLALKGDIANLRLGDTIKEVKSENLSIGDIIVVRKGELVPVDGEIVKGSTSLDTSSLTGEAVLEKVGVGSKVLSGSINKREVIEVKVTHKYVDSMAYKILELTINATNNKAKIETKVSKIASFYTPIVLIIAIMISIGLPLIFKVNLSDALYRALTFLVISCPCAMAISVPLSYFAGIGRASKEKILIKGSNYLDEVEKVDTVVFDKTGTLTTGSLEIKKVKIFNNNYSKEEVLEIISRGEKYSTHPIAKLFLDEVNERKNRKKIEDFKEIDGRGVSYKLDKKDIKVGSASFCGVLEEGNIFLTIDGELVASIIFDDNVKDNAKKVINYLKRNSINTIMLTGDNKSFAKIVANKTNIDEYYAELLPEGKYTKLEKLMGDHHVMFVGDGINDAPSLVLANVGVSMGSIGSASAIEASDIVIMNDELDNIINLFRIAHKTNFIVNMNLILAISVKILILGLATFGLTSMWAAVFADTGLTLLTILNSLRILKIKKQSD